MNIHNFAASGDADGVRAELAKGVLVDIRDECDFTPLAYAVAKSDANLEVIELLIAEGADINAPIENGESFPIGLAACSGNLESVRCLLHAGAEVNTTSAKGYTALINSIYRLHDSASLVPMVDLLIEHGADVNCESDYGESPLIVASRRGRFDAVRILLDAKAVPSPLGWTDLSKAVAIGSRDELKHLLESSGIDNKRDCFGRTPGILAATIGSVEKGQLLLSHGWNVNERGKNQETALMCCASANHSNMLKWLIDAGADLDAVDDAQDTALILAAGRGWSDCVRLLLEARANPRIANEYGGTAMSSASTVEVVRQLQDAGEELAQISTKMKRELTGLSSYKRIDCSSEEYKAGKNPFPGNANPQLMEIPFWHAMVRAGCDAYNARSQFGNTHQLKEPVWCFSRFGCSFTELPDGRFVQIAGEHEDYYDPDFYIYNDVIVHSARDEFSIYGYPKEIFRPTDFHSATYIDGYIYIVGCLGYHGTRLFGTTPVYRLSCEDWSIEAVPTRGDSPGWIHNHSARLNESGILVISGGNLAFEKNGEETFEELNGEYSLNLSTMTWSVSN
ncbi:MAG: ankyrin repeat domain-containing protein [Pirellulales bacterium]|nr:ankyrin repeat domain-containing protein [Pirellulales bacterium]